MSTTFLLIRHATNETVDVRIAGRTPGVHLNDEGRRQTEALAHRLDDVQLDAIYSSPLERAFETAEPIAQRHGLGITRLETLNEVDFGEWTWKRLDELIADELWHQFNTFRSGMRIPGGETIVEVQARMVVELLNLCEKHPGETLAIVGHGDPIRAVISFYLGNPLDFMLRFVIDPTSVSIVELAQDASRLLLMNSTAELPLKNRGSRSST
jgi:probable phosphomutase (TIGR03848 family)